MVPNKDRMSIIFMYDPTPPQSTYLKLPFVAERHEDGSACTGIGGTGVIIRLGIFAHLVKYIGNAEIKAPVLAVFVLNREVDKRFGRFTLGSDFIAVRVTGSGLIIVGIIAAVPDNIWFQGPAITRNTVIE